MAVVAVDNREMISGPVLLARGTSDSIDYILLRNNSKPRMRIDRYIWAYLGPIVLVLYTLATIRRADAYIIYLNTAASRFVLVAVLRLLKKKVVIELNEFPYSTEGSRFIRLPLVRRVLQKFVLKSVMPLANGFLVISDSLRGVAELNAPRAALLQVPVLGERSLDACVADAKVAKDLYVFHAGSLSEQKDGILSIFKAFAIAHHRLRIDYGVHLKLYLTSKTTLPSTWARLSRLLAEEGLNDQLVIVGYCSMESLECYLRGALALVINKPANFQNRHNFPTRVGGYLASGRPLILAADDGEANKFLANGDNAIVVKPDDVAAIATALVQCYENPEEAARIGRRGMETYSDHIYFAAHAKRLSNFIRSL